MTKEMLFLSMEGIDDDILEESEAAVHKGSNSLSPSSPLW